MTSLKVLTVSVVLLATSACTHSIHKVHVSDFSPYAPVEQGKIVKASAEQFTVMGFVKETDYVDQAVEKLKSECPSGELTGITTQFSTSHGFFSWTNKVLLQGLCLADNSKSSGSKASGDSGTSGEPSKKKKKSS